MYSYIIGKIISINKKSITLENSYFGYVVNVIEPTQFELNKIKKIYLYKHSYLSNKNSIVEDYYGFLRFEEKEFFMNCIAISGIGPKTAISFLKNDISLLKQLIASKDITALEQLQHVTKKYAYLLVDYLSDYYVKSKVEGFDSFSEVISTLKALGYSQEEIGEAINGLSKNNELQDMNDVSDLVSLAIKTISNNNELKASKA